MKKEYEVADIQIIKIIKISTEDILTSSPEFGGETEGDGGTIPWLPSGNHLE